MSHFSEAAARTLAALTQAAARLKGRALVIAAAAAAFLLLPLFLGLIIQNRKPGDVAARRGSLQPSVPLVGTLDAFPDRALSGVLRRIGSLGASEKNESRSFPVTIALDQTDPSFRPGMIARATISGEKIENALLLPIEAVRTDEQGPYTVVVSALGSTSVRRIKIGRSTSRQVEILSGLDTGDIVRISGE